MILHQVSHPPGDSDVAEGYSESAVYGEQFLENLIHEAWYWYWAGNYCGTGEIFMRTGDEFWRQSLGHCSCYGPLEPDRFLSLLITPGKSFSKLVKDMTPNCASDCKCLIDAVIKSEWGLKNISCCDESYLPVTARAFGDAFERKIIKAPRGEEP